jgi:hypothetical protein
MALLCKVSKLAAEQERHAKKIIIALVFAIGAVSVI